jgi:general secretion pathway protein E
LIPIALSAEAFDERLSGVYRHSEQSAAELVEDIGQDLDLVRLVEEMPPLEDLLDTDQPGHCMINALLGQAVREAVSDIHRTFERYSIVRFRLMAPCVMLSGPTRSMPPGFPH